LGFADWISNRSKISQNELKNSEDFRKKKQFIEPKIAFLNSDYAFPYIGIVRGYHITLVLLFLFYLIFKSPLIGILAGINILFVVLWEFYVGSKTTGIKVELRDTVIALLFGALVWFGAGFILNTPTPINAIVSCSMLPAYERGDMLILQGAQIDTMYLEYNGSKKDFENTYAKVEYMSENYTLNGSLYSFCQENMNTQMCMDFVKQPSQFVEKHGSIKLVYGVCTKKNIKTSQKKYIPCVKETYYNNQKIEFSKDYDLLVYQPKKTDLYSVVGDIVHRTRFAINCTDGTIYFTKGDNNPIYDFQIYTKSYNMGNTPISEHQIKGKDILRIPFIGNFKLFITPQILFMNDEATGCDSYIVEE